MGAWAWLPSLKIVQSSARVNIPKPDYENREYGTEMRYLIFCYFDELNLNILHNITLSEITATFMIENAST